ncbi:hypothetical protein [Winogradskyella sp. 3972H.M.0a.05]|uniref:hypothetical protein n=1 Tax=Winogradskyella sp. 3972H.M.0a.05 TaxID=2950277 RepID=UPI00339215F9
MRNLNFDISPEIEKILNSEIDNGNSIFESNMEYPDKGFVLIIMNKPFYKKYSVKKLEYRSLNDPHYWKEEYHDKALKQTIACKF